MKETKFLVAFGVGPEDRISTSNERKEREEHSIISLS
jgi:hypothetical protein